MLVLLPAPASDLQGTEPLPWWALSSRVFHQPVLVHLGIMCYGLYLVHWPLVVWFGDSQLNTIHSEHTWGGRQPGLGPLGRDIAIAVASLVITAVSFFKFEIP